VSAVSGAVLAAAAGFDESSDETGLVAVTLALALVEMACRRSIPCMSMDVTYLERRRTH
jgi:hypothetical protein